VINTRVIPTLVEQVQMGLVASVTQDAVALVWLTDHTKAEAAALNLEQHKMDAGVDHVLRGAALADMFGDPAQEPRAPDLAVIVQEGVIYADSAKGGEHGGFSDDDRHVALVVAAPGAGSKTVDDGVETRQVAPTVLQALGLDPAKLDSVKAEGTHPLP
jgi:arylsulfatase A-like enzyme